MTFAKVGRIKRAIFIILLAVMRIFVHSLTGVTITLDAEPSDTIKSIKQKIEDKQGIPSEQQRLVFPDIPTSLEHLNHEQNEQDEHTLQDCNVSPNSALQLVNELAALPSLLDADIGRVNKVFPQQEFPAKEESIDDLLSKVREDLRCEPQKKEESIDDLLSKVREDVRCEPQTLKRATPQNENCIIA